MQDAARYAAARHFPLLACRMITCLIVDDDPVLRELVGDHLTRYGLQARLADSAAAMRLELQRGGIDIILLDLMLPDGDGIELCRDLRTHSKMPVIMLTAQGDPISRVLGLEMGADDYVAKPFEPRELLARCKSVLRRSANKTTPSRLERVRMGRHTLDLAKRALHDDTGADVAVTPGEFDILKIFAENPNRPLSRDWLLETTSHRTRDPFDRAIDLRITRIRRKIEPSP